jgi:hypothetical protein
LKGIIIISLALLTIFLSVLMWLQKYPEENLAERLSNSTNFIAYNKLMNERFQLFYLTKRNQRKDSIKKELTRHIFDYSFKEKESLTVVVIPERKDLLKRNSEESFIYFTKIYQEFPELKKFSNKSKLTIFIKARQILNGK